MKLSKFFLLVSYFVFSWSFTVEAAFRDPVVFGPARCFNGQDDYVLVPNSSSLNVTGGLTIEAWIKMDQLPGPVPGYSGEEYAIVSKWAGTGSAGGRYLFGVLGGANSGKLILNLQDIGAISNQSLQPGQWYHVAVTYDGSNFRFYINGQLDNTVSGASSFGFSSTPLAIGKNIHNNITPSVNPYFFKGEIDEVRISNIVRSQFSFCLNAPCTPDGNTMALWHLNEVSGTLVDDASANNNDGTVQGTGCPQPPQIPQVNLANIFPIQVLEKDIDVNGDNTPDLIVGKKTQVFLEFSSIPGLNATINNVDLDIQFGVQPVGSLRNLTIRYENGAPTVVADKFVRYNDRNYPDIVFEPLPLQINRPFSASIVQPYRPKSYFTTTKVYDTKGTGGLDVAFIPLDWENWNTVILDFYFQDVKKGSDFIKGAFPLDEETFKQFRIDTPLRLANMNLPCIARVYRISADVYAYAKSRFDIDRVVAIVPPGWINTNYCNLQPEVRGKAPETQNTTVFVELGFGEKAIPHELGHTYGLPNAINRGEYCLGIGNLCKGSEEYGGGCPGLSTCPDGFPADHGFWVEKSREMGILNMGDLTQVNFMGAASSRDFWVDSASFTYLFDKFNQNPGDPELLIVGGVIDISNNIQYLGLTRVAEGTPSDSDSGPYSVELVDSYGATLLCFEFSPIFYTWTPNGAVNLDTAGFAFAIPYEVGATTLLIKHGNQIIHSLNPLTKTLTDAINAIPSDGFVKGSRQIQTASVSAISGSSEPVSRQDMSPDERRKALLNKVNALEHLLTDGYVEEAKLKLTDDILKHIQTWLIDNYPIDSTVIPMQVSKEEVVSLIYALLPKLEWYQSPTVTSFRPVEIVSDVGKPATFTLRQNSPNPFNLQTTISYSLPENSEVTIDVYNISGQKVRTLVNGFQTAGYKTVTWDGTNDSGQPVSSGVYFYRIKAGESSQTKKMTLLK